MRNMLIALAAVTTLTFVGNVIAASPDSHEARSVLVESASDLPASTAVQRARGAQTMVNTQIEPPVVYTGNAVSPKPQPIHQQQVHQHQGHQRQTYRRSQPKKKQSTFDKLMDLERRKNAWLKKTFLGR